MKHDSFTFLCRPSCLDPAESSLVILACAKRFDNDMHLAAAAAVSTFMTGLPLN
jgi:hypothetical protein